MKNRISTFIEHRNTQGTILAACFIGPLVGYMGFGRMGLFVAALTVGVLLLASVLWTAFVPASKIPR